MKNVFLTSQSHRWSELVCPYPKLWFIPYSWLINSANHQLVEANYRPITGQAGKGHRPEMNLLASYWSTNGVQLCLVAWSSRVRLYFHCIDWLGLAGCCGGAGGLLWRWEQWLELGVGYMLSRDRRFWLHIYINSERLKRLHYWHNRSPSMV